MADASPCSARLEGTVRHEAGAWTAAVHRLLRHLRDNGMDWVPEPLGVDDSGQEVLGYLPGRVHPPPFPGWVWADGVLVEAAHRLAVLHRASLGFDRAGARWRLPSHQPAEVICHNVFAPDNFVFDGTRVAAVIGFDSCSPGPRIRDLAYLACRLVPLAAPGRPDLPATGLGARRLRLDLLCRGYGSHVTSEQVVGAVVARLKETAGGRDGPEHRADADWVAENRWALTHTIR